MFVNYPQMPTGKLPTKEFFIQLVAFAKNELLMKWKCYKIRLNCDETKVGFYQKCGFKNGGYNLIIK